MSDATKMAEHARDLAALRYQIQRALDPLPLTELRRIRDILDKLSPADLRKIAAYAAALADWPDPAAQ